MTGMSSDTSTTSEPDEAEEVVDSRTVASGTRTIAAELASSPGVTGDESLPCAAVGSETPDASSAPGEPVRMTSTVSPGATPDAGSWPSFAATPTMDSPVGGA